MRVKFIRVRKSFNRTNVELKLQEELASKTQALAFNRTNVELKPLR